MIAFEVDFRGGRDIEAALKQLPGSVAGRVLRAALAKAGNVIRDDARKTLKGRGHTRGTYMGVIVQRQRNPTPHTALVSVGYRSHIFWLKFLEDGTPPHPISVKNSKVLGFLDDGGEWVTWGRHFPHPGTKKQPWLRPAFDGKHRQALDTFGVEIWDAIRKATAKLRRI